MRQAATNSFTTFLLFLSIPLALAEEKPPNLVFILAENTLLIFSSDNGDVCPVTPMTPLKGPPDMILPVHGTDELYWCATPLSVICRGDWKLTQYFEDERLELYNVKDDLSEKIDLSKKFPKRTVAMKQELETWQKEVKAPIPTELNPGFKNEN